MDQVSVQKLIESYDLPPHGKQYLVDCVGNGPARNVLHPGSRTVVGHYFSEKLQATRQFESVAGEMATMVLLDADTDVLSYYSQIQTIEIPTLNKRGRAYVKRYTPDLMVLRREYPEIIEVKLWPEIERLAKEESHHWEISTPDCARFLPAEEHYAEMGLRFAVFNASSVPQILVSNIRLILNIIRSQYPPTVEETNLCVQVLTKQAWLTLRDLQFALGHASLEKIIYFIVKGVVYADLRRQRLCEPTSIVSLSPELLTAILENRLLPSAPAFNGKRIPSLQDSTNALEKMKLAETGTCRQARRMRQKIKEGAIDGKTPFESLFPRTADRGNRTEKLATKQRDFLVQHQEQTLLSGKIMIINQAYDDYLAELRKAKNRFPPVSCATYYTHAQRLDNAKIQAAIHGVKAGNAIAKPIRPEHKNLGATRAFQRGLIDHTLLKLQLVVASDAVMAIVRRPWLTTLTDEYSNCVLAQWLSFSNPSIEAIAMLLRICIIRHGRIPEVIHSDRGSDFTSKHARALMAYLGVTRQFSPVASPKYNSIAEAYFAKQQRGLIERLPGNIVKYVPRKTEALKKPEYKAIYTPTSLYQLLFNYEEEYNAGLRGDDAIHRAHLLTTSVADLPSTGNVFEWNDDVYYWTCVPVRSVWTPTERGSLYIDGKHFYSPCLRGSVKKSELEVRIDPWNSNVIYIHRKGRVYVASTMRNATQYQGSDICRQFGESLRIRMCRSERDLLKASHNVNVASIIADSIAAAKTEMEIGGARNEGQSKEVSDIERSFISINQKQLNDYTVEWD